MLLLLRRSAPVDRAPAPALVKSQPAAVGPEVGQRINFLSDTLTDKGPATGEIVNTKITVDGLYVTVRFADGQQMFSWDDLEEAGADVRAGLWMVKSHPSLFPGPSSPAQAKAGNFKKRRLAWNGLTLCIENEAGTVREGPGWETRMLFPYGEIEDTEAEDGDRVDVYLGPYLDTAEFVFVVHQRKFGRWDDYDEDKCMLGFLSEEEAAIAYLQHYDDPRFLGHITCLPVAEFVAKVRATRDDPGMVKSWLGDADLLKATSKKMVLVPGYTKKDGTVVPPHQQMVHYNPEHTFASIAEGGVSHSQKQAHKKLTGEGWWHGLSADDKAIHVMALATEIQDQASASAAVSGWKAAAKAGKNPSDAQWAAFHALPKVKQAEIFDSLVNSNSADFKWSHLKPPKRDAKPARAPKPPEPLVETPADQIPPPEPPDTTDYVSLLVQIEKSGSYYQKEALKELKAEKAWALMNSAEQYGTVMALYKVKQGAASQSAAVSGWKKSLLAGKVPSPSQHSAFIALAKQDAMKAKAVSDAVATVIGGDVLLKLTAQANTKLAEAGSAVVAPAATPAPVAIPGNMTFEPVKANSLPPGWSKPSPSVLQFGAGNVTIVVSKAASGKHLIVTQYINKKTEYHAGGLTADGAAALISNLGVLSGWMKPHFDVLLGPSSPDIVPVAPPVSVPAPPKMTTGKLSNTTVTAPKTILHNTSDGHYKQWSVYVAGKKMVTEYGKIHGTQAKTEKMFASHNDAIAAAEKLTSEKKAKGYTHHQTDWSYKAQVELPPGPDTGPKDGDTKMGADGMLVFKDGRWHKQEKKPIALTAAQLAQVVHAHPTTVPDNVHVKAAKFAAVSGDLAELKKIQAKVEGLDTAMPNTELFIQKLVDTVSGKLGAPSATPVGKLTLSQLDAVVDKVLGGKPLAKVNMEKIALAKQQALSGNSAAIKVTVGKLSASAPKTKAALVAILHSMGVSPSVTASVAPPAPTKPPAFSAPPPPPPVASVHAPTKAGDPTPMDGWTKVGEQKGSNPGGTFKDKNGVSWYCKFPADEKVARNELLAAKFYQMLGANVPMLKLVKDASGNIGIASKWTDGLSKGSAAQLAKAKGVFDSFAIDAWLGNWDVVGATNDNLLLGPSGPLRVDVGGSLIYRAQGGKKADFGDTVPELETMLDASKNPKAAAVFQGITKADMKPGLTKLNMLKRSQIIELVDKIGPGTAVEKKALADILVARRAFILKKFGIADQWDKVQKLDPSKLPVNPADLPSPIVFDKSSKAHVNAQNQKDSAALIAFAAKGNLTALKEYKYEAVDKESGKSLGMKSILDHPSNKLKEQWADLIELLQSIATPSIPTLDMPSLGAVSALGEISDFVGSFAPTDRPETVATEHRMGFFMALNQIDDIHGLLAGHKWHFLNSSSAWVQSMHAKFSSLSSLVRKYISAVQSSGHVNHAWSQGKTSAVETPIQKLTAEIYNNAVALPEGVTLRRGMTDTTAGKSMSKQLLKAKPGLVIQNTDSMCASYNESHGWGGDVQMIIRCPKGSKATPSFASGKFSGEHEVTTLPGQRYVVLSTKQTGDGVQLEVLMLPPHEGFVAQVGKLSALGKALQSAVLFLRRVF